MTACKVSFCECFMITPNIPVLHPVCTVHKDTTTGYYANQAMINVILVSS